MKSLRQGITRAGRRNAPSTDLHFPLRGPAGLFKSKEKHPLCWHILEFCNVNLKQCPLEVLTYHRKGNSYFDNEVINGSRTLLQNIYADMPQLRELQIANE